MNIEKADYPTYPVLPFHETPLDHIGGAQFSPQRLGKPIKGQPIRQILFQLLDQTRTRRCLIEYLEVLCL